MKVGVFTVVVWSGPIGKQCLFQIEYDCRSAAASCFSTVCLLKMRQPLGKSQSDLT